MGVSSDVIGSCGLALGEVDRAAHEVGDAMVSRRDFDRPVAGSGGEASLRQRAVIRGRVVGRPASERRAIGHGELEGSGRWLNSVRWAQDAWVLIAHFPHGQVAMRAARATRTAMSAS